MQKKIKESTGRTPNKNKSMNTERTMIVRVTKDEFELSDGRIYPMMFDFANDEIPSVTEFQKQYDNWLSLFGKLGLTGHEQTVSIHQ